MHKGGIADKVGNRYEARWLTHQLLGLLDGTVQSITIEALGDDEQGFEFSLMRAGGAEWHQCKRQTAAGTWSIAALDGAGVLRSEEHTSELQSLMRISYAVFCLKKKQNTAI